VYLSERDVESLAELQGLVAAHVAHWTQAGEPGIVAGRRLLDDLADRLDPAA
jgi:hypothetical protein